MQHLKPKLHETCVQRQKWTRTALDCEWEKLIIHQNHGIGAGYLQFENHEVGRWSTFELKDVIDLLDNLPYTCVWQQTVVLRFKEHHAGRIFRSGIVEQRCLLSSIRHRVDQNNPVVHVSLVR